MIEFRCQQCGATLRVPTGTEGKQAKCPQCSALMTIPTPTARPADPFRPAPQAGPADFSAPPPREGAFAGARPAAETTNPFQSPQFADVPYRGIPQSARGFHPSKIEFGRTFEISWQIFKANLGILVGATAVIFVVWLGMVIATAAIEIAITGFEERGPNAAVAMLNLLSNIVTGLVQTFLALGMIRITLNVVRGEPAMISQLFGEGGKLASAFGANILFGIASMIGFFVFIVGMIWVALTFSLIFYMILDQGAGVSDSFKMSRAAMAGNRLTLLGLWLALFGISLLVGLPTCGLGFLVIVPFAAVLLTVVYLGATGQLPAGQSDADV